MFTLFPAIDLRFGRVVRLQEGRDDQKTEYGDDPVAMARSFEEAGAAAIHVVDLDAAFRDGDNRTHIANIARAVSIPVQVGGGLRDDDGVDRLVDLGVRRVIIGSAAVSDPDWVGTVVQRHGDRVVVGIDARDGEVRTHGWVEGSGQSVTVVGQRMRERGVQRVIYTDIGRDGMLVGPDIDGSVALARDTGLEVVISGGVGNVDHLRACAATGEPLVIGVIVGKAIYDGKVSVADALEACRC